jgi:hypothetical protein
MMINFILSGLGVFAQARCVCVSASGYGGGNCNTRDVNR